MLGFLFKHISRFLVITLVTLVIVVALLSGLLRLGLPYASSYKNEIQAWVSNYLRAPVELGSFDLGWSGFSPSLRLKEVTLKRDGDQRVDMKLDEILLDLDLYKSLFTGDIHINEVTFAGADLVLEYVGKQQFTISSYRLPAGSRKNASRSSVNVVSWLMNAERVGLLNSRIRIVDSKRKIDYQIDNLDISAENTATLHRLRLSMDLPEQLGASLQVDMDLHGTSDALDETNGKFYASVSGMNVENWMRIWPNRSLDVAGDGNMEFWGGWADNQLLSVRGRLDGSSVQVAKAGSSDNKPVEFPSIAIDLFWQRGASGWRAEIDKLDFEFGETKSRIRNALVAAERLALENRYTVAGEGDSLALAAVGGLLGELGQTGMPGPVASYFRSAQLNGHLTDWKLIADIVPGESPAVSVLGSLNNVGAAAVGKIPGVQNLTGRLELNDNIGQFELGSKDLVAVLPNAFSQPLSLERINGTFAINLGDSARLVSTENLSVRNQGLATVSGFSLGRDTDNDWHIDLQAAAQLNNIASVPGYLPDRIMPRQATRWIADALIAGRASSGSLLMYGKLKDFPYTSTPGLFRAEVVAENATLKFMPDWPAGTQLNGTAIFEGDGVSFSVREGALGGTRISRVKVDIADLRKPYLKITGATSGSLQSFIDFSNNGPLKKILSPAFEESTGTGNAVLNLKLGVPLRSIGNRPASEVLAVDGTVFFKDNGLQFDRFDIALDAMSGAVSFSEIGLVIDNLDARFLDAPITVKAGTRTTASGDVTELTAKGLLRASSVLSHFKIPVYPFFAGPSQWNVTLGIPRNRSEGGSADSKQAAVTLTATSDLIGTTISLPEPMRKNSATKRPVVVQAKFDQSGIQVWRIEDGEARLHLQAEPEQGLKSLSVLFGRGNFSPDLDEGIYINGLAPELSLDGWIETVSKIIDALPKSEAGGARIPILPIQADVGAQQMIVGKTNMGAARFRANTDTSYVNATINSSHLSGSIRIPRAHWDKTQAIKTRIVYADSQLLDALSGSGEPSSAETGKNALLDPTRFPRLEAHVSRFVFKTLTLRNLGLRAEPDAAGMKITALGFANENTQVLGEGTWHLTDPQQLNPALAESQQSSLTLDVQSNNIGLTLQQAGYEGVLAEGEGSAAIKLSWPGAVYKPELGTLTGDASIYAKDGRILKIDPGAARLVGLIALQEIPRRLSLDFRDLVKDGLDYNRISGNFTLANGIAHSTLLRLEGPIGVVEIQGDSDLLGQTFDQSIIVLPRVSAALPIIGILSGGASAGIGALLVAPVLKAFGIDIDRIGLTEYRMTGSWDKPIIDQITRVPLGSPNKERE